MICRKIRNIGAKYKKKNAIQENLGGMYECLRIGIGSIHFFEPLKVLHIEWEICGPQN